MFVVEPSLATMEARIADLLVLSQTEIVAEFSIGPAKQLLRTTLVGYCLSIQSLWEKQIRGYLEGCARELQAASPTATARIRRANWDELNALFEEVRGVPLTAFEQYTHLNMLQLLGNFCRHGSGVSLNRLATEHPELWPPEPVPENLPPPPCGWPEQLRTAENIHISLELLKALAGAIDSFWQETEYIYNESINPKHPSLETRLAEERKKRAGRGRPWDPPA